MLATLQASFQSLLLLAIRLFWGIGFIQSGWEKLQDTSTVANFFSSLQIPFPALSAFLVGGIETIGGLCLLLGIFSRWASTPLIATMIVALFTAHHAGTINLGELPHYLVKQPPFNYLLASMIVLAFGPGKISLDFLLHRDG